MQFMFKTNHTMECLVWISELSLQNVLFSVHIGHFVNTSM